MGYENVPKHNESESLSLLRALQRSYAIEDVSQKYQKFKKSETATLSQLL